MSLRASAQPAWILHRRNYRDSSLILDLLTLDHGRISVVARGARKAKSGGQLQLFRPLAVDFFLRAELGTLGKYELLGPAVDLQATRLWCGFYCNELLLNLLPQAGHTDTTLFELYQQLMQVLPQHAPARVLRYFEYRLLEICGFGFDPQLIQADRRYSWSPLQGLSESRGGVAGAVLMELMTEGWSGAVEDSKSLLADILKQQLAGKPMKTAAMLRELQALKQQNAATQGTKH